jgi:hypothetical protein
MLSLDTTLIHYIGDNVTRRDTVLEAASCVLNKVFFQCMRLEVPSLVTIYIVISWAMTPCNLICWYQGFVGMYCLYFFLKMELVCCCETLLTTYHNTPCHNPEDHDEISLRDHSTQALSSIFTFLTI